MTFSKKIYIRGVIFLIGIVLLIFLIIVFSAYFSLHDAAKWGLVTFFCIGFIYYPINKKLVNWLDSLIWPSIDKNIKDIKNGKRGFEGEDEVNSWLEDIVGKEKIIRNIQFEDCDFDIDLIAVSSKGVFVLEVKNLTDPVYFESDDYFYESENGEKLLSSFEDPRSEARRHANSLRNYLNNNGFESVRMNMIVAFANGKVDWNGKSGIYIAKNKESLGNYISRLAYDPKCTPEVCEKIKSLLKNYSKF